MNATNNPFGQPHYHDDWGGQHRLQILSKSQNVTQDCDCPDGWPVVQLWPDPGSVVPQGTAWVNVTVSWTDDFPLDSYSFELAVKKASDTDSQPVATLAKSGATLAIRTDNSMDDLPHQVLSQWRFEVFLHRSMANPLLHAVYRGVLTLVVTADRGLPVPLFPPHPDQWGNRTSLPLFQVANAIFAVGHTECDFNPGPCYPDYHPDAGQVVPWDARLVVVHLKLSDPSATTLGIMYHGAQSRQFIKLKPTQDSTSERTYVIAVESSGDSPYAKNSEWEFEPFIEGPVEDSFISQHYTLDAVAQK